MKLRKITALLCAAVLAAAGLGTDMEPVSAKGGTMRDLSTMQIVNDMGIGINLGNTFESCGDWIDQWGNGTPNAYETAWGSPTITRDMIHGYAEAGFGVVRIPVAWSNMMADDGSYTIHPDYMARVKEVVDWTLDENMYVILNLHWDSGWLEKMPEQPDFCLEKYAAIWRQISAEFADYGDMLMFESQNEELGWSSLWNQWGGTQGKAESYGYVNQINQTFVDIVRSSSGNNPQRHLLISGYNTDIALTCDQMFQMPADPAQRCAVSVHYYTPAGFAILENDADWGKASSTWGTDAEVQELKNNISKLDARFSAQGIPVIIGEYGCPKKNKEPESVRRFISGVCEEALRHKGICPVLWDTTGQHYDRSSCRMTDSTLNAQLVALRDTYRGSLSERTEGDVNGDGSMTIVDAVLLQSWLLGKEVTGPFYGQAADLNADEHLNGYDLAMMKTILTE